MLDGIIATRFEAAGPQGSGAVFFPARDLATGRDVALKLLPPLADEAARLQFKQEFRTLARLRHPNLGTVDDFGFLPDGRAFLCMARVAGEPLPVPMSVERLLALLPPLAHALGYIHRHGLVHGAVAVAALQLGADGQPILIGPHAMIASGQVAPAQAGGPVAPELAQGDRVDARTDLYALGATCYQLLTGEPLMEEATPDLGRLLPDLPPAIAQAITRLLAREPVARPRSAAEALALFGLAGGEQADRQPLVATFAGRAEELALFQQELAGLPTAKAPRILGFAGSAGAGKTRLLDELRTLVRLEGLPFLTGACGVGAARPFGPFLDMLRASAQHLPAALAGASVEHRAALGRVMPELGLPPGPDPLEPREERILVNAAICQALRALAGPAGAVLALDDWDRADGPSVEALAYLRRNAGDTPFLVVATAREAGYLGAGARTLGPLGRDDAAQLAASMLGEGRPPASFLAALHRWTGGHAGHVQRITAHLVQTGALERKGGRWSAPRGLAAGDLAPELLELARAPLSALTEPAARLAELAAVLEADADLAALAELSGYEEDVLFQALGELQARQIVGLAEGRVRFGSGGLQQAAYEAATEGRRLWLHAQAALYLEDALAAGRRSDPEARIALVRHAIASGQFPKILPLALPAAELLMARFEVDVARALLRDALALAMGWPEDHPAWRRDVLVHLAAIERWRGDPEAMTACLDEAQPLAEQLAEPGPLLRAWVLRAARHNLAMTPVALGQAVELLQKALALPVRDPVWQVRGRFFLAQAHFYRGQAAEAKAAFAEAARAAEADGLPFWQANSLAFLGYLQAGDGDEQGFGLLAAAAAIQVGLGDRYGQGFTFALQGDALLSALRLAEAEAAFDAQQAVAAELGVGEDHVTGLVNLATVRLLAGHPNAALETCQQALPLAAAQGLAVGLLGQAVRGLALAYAGDLPQAAAALAEVGGGSGYMFLHALPFLLEGWRWLGRPDEIIALAQATRPAWRSNPNPTLQAQVAALEAEARLAREGPASARGLVREAGELARTSGAPLAMILAQRAEARVALAEGQPEAARLAAEAALALAMAAGAAGLMAELEGLLGEIGDGQLHHKTMRRLAERHGLPFLRALALGQTDEARQIIRSLADGLEPLARNAFLAMPACAKVLGEAPARPATKDRVLAMLEDLAVALRPQAGVDALLAEVARVAQAHVPAGHVRVALAGQASPGAATELCSVPLMIGPERAALHVAGAALSDDDLALLGTLARHAAGPLAAGVAYEACLRRAEAAEQALAGVSDMYQDAPAPGIKPRRTAVPGRAKA
ncbi:MAG: putative serine/threonine protein kinase [Cyanobacteria bacterium RYN_339]|nr:putative serine/threonine protein kinase [Cyanobacteria bacterium RYN_339]